MNIQVLSKLNLLIDRTYQPSTGSQGPIDYGFLKRLFDRLLEEALPALQNPSEAQRKVKNKSFATVGPFGNVPVQACMTLALRVLRLSPTHSPKQARVDKAVFEEVICVAGNDLHTQAWHLIDFLVENVEGGMTAFEAEMADLCAERLRSDMQAGKISSASKKSLNAFARIVKSLTSGFNGGLFVREVAKSEVLGETGRFLMGQISSLLKRGIVEESQPQAKRARYHQVAQNDKERQLAAEGAFKDELVEPVELLLQVSSVFGCGQCVLSPEEHCKLVEQLICLQVNLQRAAHNVPFLPDFNAQIFANLTEAAVSFQPAFLPPFLGQVLRILAGAAHGTGEAGREARRGMLRIETLLHPRRKGPVTFRPITEAVSRVYEREEVIGPVKEVEEAKEELKEVEQPAEAVVQIEKNSLFETVKFAEEKKSFFAPKEFIKTAETLTLPKPEPPKQSNLPIQQNHNDDDDEPLPQIIDCEPDEQ